MTSINDLVSSIEQSDIRPSCLAIERLMTTGEAIGFSTHFEIHDSREPLVEISGKLLRVVEPHPHLSIGAVYGKYSPFCVREGVLDRLNRAAFQLSKIRPGCRLLIYDAYRPLSVQRFMIDHEFSRLAAERKIETNDLDQAGYQSLMDEVLTVWASPNTNLNSPPPHSTGAAIDLTIIDEAGELLDMGSAIDAIGDVSLPNYFADSVMEREMIFHSNRELLNQVMAYAGFHRLPHEWWHFSYGDQMWALLKWLEHPEKDFFALYGRVEV